MPSNFPGPYGLEFVYTANGLTHTQNFNIDVDGSPQPGVNFNTVLAVTNDNSLRDLDDVVNDWSIVWQDLYKPSQDTLDSVTLWEYTPLTFDRRFIASKTLAIPGTETLIPTTDAGQAIFTFRTVEGGVMKVSLMQPTIEPGPPLGAAGLTQRQTALVNLLLGPNGVFIGRDTSRLVSFLRLLPGRNEALFKRLYR
jgi:hypothetical protein